MAQTPAVVRKTTPAPLGRDPFHALRAEMDRMFDRFAGGFGFPSLWRALDVEPDWERSFSFAAPAVDIVEDDKAYRIDAELPGLSEKDVDVSLSGDTLVLKGSAARSTKRRGRTTICLSAATARSSAASPCPKVSIATRSRRLSPRECSPSRRRRPRKRSSRRRSK